MEKSILYMFPQEYRNLWSGVAARQEDLQEIRLRLNQPVTLLLKGVEMYVSEAGEPVRSRERGRCIHERELRGMLEHICRYSPYAFEEELRRGFVTVAGGHRVGVAGQAVLESDGSIRTIKNISFVNIRVSHQKKGAADGVVGMLYCGEMLNNTLIISPPGCGKTTLLRDMIRQISDGNPYGVGRTVGVVDERSELAGSFLGMPQNDVGMRTDVLDGCPKNLGMQLLLRSMSPRVIAIDELGSRGEIVVLQEAAASGCNILATAHGEDLKDVERRFAEIPQIFDLFIILGREKGNCVIKKVIHRDGCRLKESGAAGAEMSVIQAR